MTRPVRYDLATDVTLWQGAAEDVLPGLPARVVDAVITDPPYSSGGQFRGDRTQPTRTKYQSTGVQKVHAEFSGDARDQRGYLAWSALWMRQALASTKPGGLLCVFSDWRQLPITSDAIQAAGWTWRGIIPWDKQNSRPQPDRPRCQCEYVLWATNGPRPAHPTPDARYHPGLIAAALPPTAKRTHAAEKPLAVLRQLVTLAPDNGLICDPFLGSGTTAVASIQEGRRFVGCEQHQGIFADAIRRIESSLAQPLLHAAPL